MDHRLFRLVLDRFLLRLRSVVASSRSLSLEKLGVGWILRLFRMLRLLESWLLWFRLLLLESWLMRLLESWLLRLLESWLWLRLLESWLLRLLLESWLWLRLLESWLLRLLLKSWLWLRLLESWLLRLLLESWLWLRLLESWLLRLLLESWLWLRLLESWLLRLWLKSWLRSRFREVLLSFGLSHLIIVASLHDFALPWCLTDSCSCWVSSPNDSWSWLARIDVDESRGSAWLWLNVHESRRFLLNPRERFLVQKDCNLNLQVAEDIQYLLAVEGKTLKIHDRAGQLALTSLEVGALGAMQGTS
ncbi:hypothetical protein B566_EDAN009385 [Ephemera danica]|nr:hypothetical protein B566_EDAN009385 [Ephemera danica]